MAYFIIIQFLHFSIFIFKGAWYYFTRYDRGGTPNTAEFLSILREPMMSQTISWRQWLPMFEEAYEQGGLDRDISSDLLDEARDLVTGKCSERSLIDISWRFVFAYER